MREDFKLPEQKILDLVDKEDNPTKTKIREELGVSEKQFLEYVKNLEKNGYLLEVKDPEDRRRHILQLTAKPYKDQQISLFGVNTSRCAFDKEVEEKSEYYDLAQRLGESLLFALAKIEKEALKEAEVEEKKNPEIEKDYDRLVDKGIVGDELHAVLVDKYSEEEVEEFWEKVTKELERQVFGNTEPVERASAVIDLFLKELLVFHIPADKFEVFGVDYRKILDYANPELHKLYEDCEINRLPRLGDLTFVGNRYVENEEGERVGKKERYLHDWRHEEKLSDMVKDEDRTRSKSDTRVRKPRPTRPVEPEERSEEENKNDSEAGE